MSGQTVKVLVGAFVLALLAAACGTVETPPAPEWSAPDSAAKQPAAAPTTPTTLPPATTTTKPPVTTTTTKPPATTTTTKPPATTTTTKPPATTTTTKPPASPPPTSSELPTRANTGPSGITGTMTAAQFLQTGVCDHQRIVDQVRDESGRMLGRTFTIRNCDLQGGIYYVDYSGSANLPTWEITDSRLNGWLMFSPVKVAATRVLVENGAYWVPCPDCGAEDHQPNQTQRPMPVVVRDSLFWKALPDPTSPWHSEALHVVGAGIGYSFTNTRFVQEGPMNGTQTGALKFTGRDSTFRNVTFDFGGTPAASYFTVYIEGTNVMIDGCRIQQGVARPGYKYPDVWSNGNGYVVPPLTGCVDFDTGAPVG